MKLIEQAKERIAPYYTPMEAVVLANQEKVLRAFHAAKVASHSFGEATGYGYADPGRETLEEVYRHVFKAEAALCRPQIVSGTHAISICLSILEPGDELVSASGPPYDTLQAVIGTREAHLEAWLSGVSATGDSPAAHGPSGSGGHRETDHPENEDGHFPAFPGLQLAILLKHRRPGRGIKAVREANPDCIVFVDNCYGSLWRFSSRWKLGRISSPAR